MENQLREVLANFKYPQSSDLFSHIIIGLAQGTSPHAIIEDLLTIIEDQRKELEEKPRHIAASVPLTDEQIERLLEISYQSLSSPTTNGEGWIDIIEREKKKMMETSEVLMEQTKASDLTSEEYNLIYNTWLDEQPNAK